MYTKESIFNLALGALLLQRQVTDASATNNNEVVVLNTHYATALRMTLEDLDLDATSTQVALTLIEEDDADFPEWKYVYRYPTNCAFFRRIKSMQTMDDRDSHIPKKVGLYGTPKEKVIFTNETDAIAEFIPNDIPLSTLAAPVGLCVAYRLAFLSAPLITGKGAMKLRKEIEDMYKETKAEAQEQDARENFNYYDETLTSEFVKARQS